MDSPTLRLTYRSARPEDWAHVQGWPEHTWEGDDYIDQHVWQHWCDSPASELTVVEQDGQIVAYYCLSKLDEAEWWLEGVRVDPARRGGGIGRALLTRLVGLMRRESRGLLRFFTGSSIAEMTHLARDAGFLHRMSFTEMTAPAGNVDYSSFKLLLPQNADMIWNNLRHFAMYRANQYVERDWTAFFLNRDRLEGYLNDPQVQVLGFRREGQFGGLAILFVDPEHHHEAEDNSLPVGYIAAPDDTTLKDMLEALRGLAAVRGRDRVTWKMPLGVGLDRSISTTAYIRAWPEGEDMWLFELPLRL